MDSAITFGEFPRYHDIIGGGDNSIPTIERGTPYHTPERTRVWRFVQRLKEDMQASKQLFSTNWDYYYSLFVGRQWVVPSKKGVLREAKLPSWRAQLTVNHILPVIDLDVATTFDNDPRPYLSATTPEQQSFVAINQAGLDQVWAAENIRDKLELAYQDCKIYGTSIIKYYWDPDADEGKGAIKSYPVAIENFLVDRAAISLHDGEYTSILELSQMPVSQVRKMYPHAAKYIRIESGTAPYQERKEVGYGDTSSWQTSTSNQFISPGSTAGLRSDASESLFQPAFMGEDYMVEVAELWIRDTSTKEVSEQYTTGRSQWGFPIKASRRKTVPAYPTGWRLITVGGGVVLQDCPAPYKRPPYVLLRDMVLNRRFWGMGIPELIGDQQIEVNKRRSQMMDSANRMGNPVWVCDTDSGVEPEMDMNEPGQVISKRPGTQIARQAPVPMPQWIMDMMHIPVSDIYSISGVAGMNSNPAAGKRSGTAVAEATSNASVRIRRKARQLDIAIKDSARIILEMISLFYTTPRWAWVMGTWGKPTPVPFDYRHARGTWDIKVESGSGAAASKLAQRQEAMMLFDKKILGPVHVLEALSWPNRDQIAKDMKYYPQYGDYQYPGWPGFPTPARNDNSGYSMAARYQNQPPPPPPGQAGPQGPPQHQGGGGGHRPGGPPKMVGMSPFGPPMGASIRR